MLKTIDTELLLEEIPTDGHAPLKFICSTNEIYFCKYLNSFNRLELNCLAYEVIANFLLTKLEVSTPEIALVNVSPNTLDKSKIRLNRRLREGNICFGSKEIAPAQELQAIQDFSKTDFNKLSKPEDIIKMALFDLWVDNRDRGRIFEDGINYNILLEQVGSKQKLIAFDNAFIFGGLESIGTFNPSSMVNTRNKLVATPFYKKVIKFIDSRNFNDTVNNFVPLLEQNFAQEISEIIEQLPKEWELTKNLDQRINDFLSNKKHINSLKNIILQSKR
ncbi:HipA family kinase [Mesonia sp.]|uniref:HipA family kinase n=1 Tax=Mesonia sp. TaxID=1960830 RepID=UPI003F955B3D